MKRNTLSIVITIILLTTINTGFLLLESEVVSAAEIINVGSGPGNDSASIENGIIQANEGDTVYVHAGTYQEHVIVNKRINLVGEGRETTIIDALGSGDIVRITADGVNVSGFTITGSGPISGDSGIELDNVRDCRVFDVNASGNGKYGIFFVSSSNCIVEDNIVHSNGGNGIRVVTSSNNTIENNDVSDNWGGIYLMDSSHNNTVMENNVTFNKGDAMYLDSSSRNTIENNIVSDNNGTSVSFIFSSYNIVRNNTHSGNTGSGYYIDRSNNNIISGNRPSNNTITGNHVSNSTTFGIYLISSQDHNISGNEFINSGISLRGYELKEFDSHDISNDNMVNGKPLYFYKYLDQEDIDGLSAGQLFLIDCTNVVLKNLIINNTAVAISITYSSNITVIDNNVSNNKRGIELISSTQCNVKNNMAVLNEFGGIELRSSSYNNLSNNNVSDNNANINLYGSSFNVISGNIIASSYEREFFDNTGLNLYGQSDYNTITGNHLTGNDKALVIHYANWNDISYNNISTNILGFYLNSAYNNTITQNYVSSNEEGFRLYFSADYNTITRNFIQGNELGINLSSSSNNLIYHNDIIDNTIQAYDNRSDNQWDNGYPGGGNYWSDYDGMDLNGTASQDAPPPDGMGDTPYVIDQDSQDNYPLMEPILQPPSEPQNVQTSSGDSYVNLTWGPPEDDGGLFITGYRVYRGIISGEEDFYTTVGNTHYFNDTDVDNGISYYYKVSAVNPVGEGPLSFEVNNTPMSFPSQPVNLTSVSGDSHVNISWGPPLTDGGSDITNYTIYRGFAPGEEVLFIEVGNVIYFNDTSVINGRTYYYSVAARNIVGEGDLSKETNATPSSVPSIPGNVTARAGDFYINLSWVPPVDDGGSRIIGYRIYRGTISEGEGFLIEIGNVSFYNDTDLVKGQIYYYMVSAVNSIGEGPLSDEASAKLRQPEKRDESFEWWLWALIAIVIAVIVIFLVVVFRNRRKQIHEED
jgi:parallel beta-helix repeat protein